MLLRHLRGPIRHLSSTAANLGRPRKVKNEPSVRITSDAARNKDLLRTLIHPRGISRKPQIINPSLCEQALEKLEPDLAAYKNAYIIDMNPGLGLWSAALYDRLQPRRHILLEPDEKFHPALKGLVESRPNAHVVKLDGYHWDTYSMLLADPPPSPPFPPDFPPLHLPTVHWEGALNTQILFTGRVFSNEQGTRLLNQFITCCAVGDWLYQFGRVRTLLWAPDVARERYLPPIIQAQGRPSLIAQTFANIHEVVASSAVRSGRGFQKTQIGFMDDAEDAEVEVVDSDDSTELDDAENETEQWQPIQEPIARTSASPEVIKSPEASPGHIKNFLSKNKSLVKFPQIPLSPPPPPPAKQRGGRGVKAAPTPLSQAYAELGQKVIENGRWLSGMEHPPWYYTQDEAAEVGKQILDRKPLVSNLGSQLEVDIGEEIQALYPGENADTSSDVGSVSSDINQEDEEDDPKARRAAFESYEKTIPMLAQPKRASMGLSISDEAKANQLRKAGRPLLAKERRRYDPVILNDIDGNVYPPRAITLLDFEPLKPNPWFRDSDPEICQQRWLVFDWLVKNLYIRRASTLVSVLRSLAPGAEYVLDELRPEEAIDPEKTVRLMVPTEFINLAKAWERWPFKPEQTFLHEGKSWAIGKEGLSHRRETMKAVQKRRSEGWLKSHVRENEGDAKEGTAKEGEPAASV